MGVITPSGDMYLLNVNIDQTQANQLWFESRYQQETFFRGKVVAGLTPADYTYIQKDDVVRVNKNADQLYNCNYLMYRNTAFSNRWFYGFVTEIQWLSDQSAAISFQTDVQRWAFAYALARKINKEGTRLFKQGGRTDIYTPVVASIKKNILTALNKSSVLNSADLIKFEHIDLKMTI